jgi:MOSC domain-containing protein YiiM
MNQNPTILAIFVGQPKTITDDAGTWTSSIFRDPVTGPVKVLPSGLEGDRVAQPYHGGKDAALCVHLMEHYRFWNREFGMNLRAGNVGENFTLESITEDQVCAGDIVQIGTALFQVSGPRVPCANLARRIGRKDWVRLTIRQNRTGFYMRVLETGSIQPGDPWLLIERLNHSGTIPAINQAMYLNYDPEFTKAMQLMEGLEDWWKEQALERLEKHNEHWTSEMRL